MQRGRKSEMDEYIFDKKVTSMPITLVANEIGPMIRTAGDLCALLEYLTLKGHNGDGSTDT